ncbi:outer membrane lipoprotein chaperone LolA [Parvibium lacunae]|uniref:Outer-membrane lipoprotein carrier protein n=1 Tax=Parvibium lacunae TaxID=1888893 RepID=A0A368L830_9BURK|nr:outer membrane lipoprotein chaperone LolA [Parvibium lacunae]RCS59764.1 outer membrane lipoprotein carrier protein LolA [Parvibium lacunae]
MNRRTFFSGLVGFWVSLLAVQTGLAATPSALEQLRQFTSQVKAARGEFTQTQTNRAGKREVWRGEFTFARPGKFRWRYSQPYEQLLVADGERFYLFDKDLNQVTVRKLTEAIGQSPAAILFGQSDLDKHYTISEDAAQEGLAWLSAQPKAKDTQFERIRIGWRNGLPEAMELHDTLGKVTTLQFVRVERAASIDSSVFRFQPAKDAPGADVLQP